MHLKAALWGRKALAAYLVTEMPDPSETWVSVGCCITTSMGPFVSPSLADLAYLPHAPHLPKRFLYPRLLKD
ncbi:hypothetical protein CEXT_204181 [Caerostris extrusa]|uniref:Uncharacterized protein n=1 Tax=Caerostris extrusa TaxID=172846 RepID=A0AAV4UT40_CAEEX|nr:hypothetical protein CEXT_204181 [Caerostris extrusa]